MCEPTDGDPIASGETRAAESGRFRARASMVLFVFVLWVLLVVGRMGYFMVLRRSHETSAMTRDSVVHGEIPALRGRLLDREGQPMAWSERRVRLLWSAPPEPAQAQVELAKLQSAFPWLEGIAMSATPAEEEVAGPVVLSRQLTAEQVREARGATARGLRLEGYVQREHGALSAPLRRRVGEIRWEGGRSVGISGLEREHDALLAGQPGLYRVLVDKHGRWVPETWQVLQPMRAGYDVHVALRRGR